MTDPRNYIPGGRRCALEKLEDWGDFHVAISPRNGRGAAVEGPWEDWVTLANGILEADRQWKAQAAEAVTNG